MPQLCSGRLEQRRSDVLRYVAFRFGKRKAEDVMSKLIKGGTIVTADLTTRADVFVQHDKIVAVGPDLAHDADHVLDASGCYVMPGGIDPHTHMEMPFMGT